MTIKYGIFLCLFAGSAEWAGSHPQFAVKSSHADTNGITFQTASGMMRVEVCGDRVVHVIVSPASKLPTPKVPIVTQTCRANNLQIKAKKGAVSLSTGVITAVVNSATGAVSFLSSDGKPLLAEPQQGGKSFDVPAIAEMKTWQIQQTFVSPSDEAQYGLGQHQEGLFDLRGVPIRLHQANTNISVPFLLSSKGYGILWNNPSLTDFNPADQSIAIDPATGKGKLTTSAKGSYGFLLDSDNKDQLVVDVDGKQVIDLVYMWKTSSALGVVILEAEQYR